MTAFTFRLLGYIAIALGLAWSVFVLVGPGSIAPTSEASTFYAGLYIGRLIVLSPGLGLVFVGLLMMAIGKALSQLERIARHAAHTSNSNAAIAEALDRMGGGRRVD